MMLSMLFVQSTQLHVHTYTHDAGTSGHIHYDFVHSVFDFSQQPHEDEVAQLDQAKSGVIAKVSFVPMLAVILVSLLLVAVCRYAVQYSRHSRTRSVVYQYDEQLRPRLRAPPHI